MNLLVINQYLGFVSLSVSLATIAWAWINRPTAETNKRIDVMERDADDALGKVHERIAEVCEDLKKHDRRIQHVEDTMKHLPTKDDLNEVTNEVTAVKTELRLMSIVMNRIDDLLRSRV